MTDSSDHTTTFDYPETGKFEVTDSAGRTTTLVYDGELLMQVIQPRPGGQSAVAGPTTTYGYDPVPSS